MLVCKSSMWVFHLCVCPRICSEMLPFCPLWCREVGVSSHFTLLYIRKLQNPAVCVQPALMLRWGNFSASYECAYFAQKLGVCTSEDSRVVSSRSNVNYCHLREHQLDTQTFSAVCASKCVMMLTQFGCELPMSERVLASKRALTSRVKSHRDSAGSNGCFFLEIVSGAPLV